MTHVIGIHYELLKFEFVGYGSGLEDRCVRTHVEMRLHGGIAGGVVDVIGGLLEGTWKLFR